MSSAPRVLAIGSCRITRPLRRLSGQGEIDMVNYGRSRWYTHTAAAGRQYLDVLDGRTQIPADLRAAALETELEFPDGLAADLGSIDVAVVEVSTLKQHRVGDIELNAHKVYGLAKQAGLPPGPIVYGNTASLPDDHVLKSMQVHFADEASVTADLTAIQARLGVPIIVVDHLHSVLSDGSPVPERARLTEMLAQISKTLGIGFYSTKAAILEYGSDVALEDQNHYRTDFEPVVAGRLLGLIRQSLT